jgi:hypothetical protein
MVIVFSQTQFGIGYTTTCKRLFSRFKQFVNPLFSTRCALAAEKWSTLTRA